MKDNDKTETNMDKEKKYEWNSLWSDLNGK